ncbi:hypothetical protein [Microcoleus sp. OTE_8_concoct_300]|uniref:hypothetical protein n=1 Tax=Microcoleus sp. OTE_8_concoct_300 TaxID=2964710 RepID=UPI00403FC021
MPVPQERLQHCHPFMNRQDACSTGDEFYCGTGILPVKREMPVPQERLQHCQ